MNLEHDLELMRIGIAMVTGGLPVAFVVRVVALARHSPGTLQLARYWCDTTEVAERDEAVADLQELLDDHEPTGRDRRDLTSSDVEEEISRRRAQRIQLRALVEAHGGVSAVARRAGMPQPSLSRLLGSLSEVRPATLNRLADAMGLPVTALAAPTVDRVQPRVLPAPRHPMAPPGGGGALDWGEPVYGHRPREQRRERTGRSS